MHYIFTVVLAYLFLVICYNDTAEIFYEKIYIGVRLYYLGIVAPNIGDDTLNVFSQYNASVKCAFTNKVFVQGVTKVPESPSILKILR